MGRELPQGHTLGAYAVERLISKTGLSAEYAARPVSSAAESPERPLRLTVFEVDPDGEPWDRFRREIAQLRALSHPSIAEVLEVGQSPGGLPFMVTALPEGEDLATRLRRAGALTTREARAIGRQVAAALHAAHRLDVLHRDLQPASIYLAERTEAERKKDAISQPGDADSFDRVLVLGFGVARLLESALTGMALVGNPEYMAPEQVTGFSLEVGPAADQHALALVLYQALTASRPFRGESVGASLLHVVRTVPEPLRALRPDIPPAVDAAVTRALAKDRLARFPDLPQFIDALQAGEPVPAELAALTDPWLQEGKSAEAAHKRAQEVSGVGPSFAALARGLDARDGVPEAGAPVPELLEDGATVPNTMEDVMRLAVPPERVKDRPSGPGAADPVPDLVAEPEPTSKSPGPPVSITVKDTSLPGELKPMRVAPRGGRIDEPKGEPKPATEAPAAKPPAPPAQPAAPLASEKSEPSLPRREGSSDIGDRPTSNAPLPANVTDLVRSEEAKKRQMLERIVFAIVGIVIGFLLRSLL